MSNERRLVPLSDIPVEPVSWLWRDRIPLGYITLIEGDPGQGKSTLLTDVAARVTRGSAMPNCPTAHGPAGVVILQGEDSVASTLRPNLQAAGADVDRVRVYDHRRFLAQPLNLSEDIGILASAVAEVQAKLVVVDPVNVFVDASESNFSAVRRALRPLEQFASQNRVAIVLVRNLTKSGSSTKALYRGIGSIAYAAVARAVLQAMGDTRNESPNQHLLVAVKTTLAGGVPDLAYRTAHRDEGLVVQWLDEVAHSQACIDVAVNSVTALRQACYVLYSILAEGPVPAIEVKQTAANALVSLRTLSRAKEILHVESKKHGGGKGSSWTWQLPADERFYREYKERDLDELMDRLIYPEGDPPPTDDPERRRQDQPRSNDDDDGDDDAERCTT
jgi:hypothetical protein